MCTFDGCQFLDLLVECLHKQVQLNFKGQDVSKSTEKHRLTFFEAGRTNSGKKGFCHFVTCFTYFIIWLVTQGCTDTVGHLDSFIS